MQKLTLLLSILEPLMVNEENSLLALKEGMIETLGRILLMNEPFFYVLRLESAPEASNQIMKLSLRSLVSCIRLSVASKAFMSDMSLFDALIDLSEQTTDEEVIANSLKVIRIIFKEPKYMYYVSSQSPSAINRVIAHLANSQSDSGGYIRREVFIIVALYCSTSQR